eukprot:6108531-Lingulodinium_polyedra.AAC.1
MAHIADGVDRHACTRLFGRSPATGRGRRAPRRDGWRGGLRNHRSPLERRAHAVPALRAVRRGP